MTTVPFTMNVYLFGIVPQQSPAFCMFWKFIDSCIYTTVPKLVAWASVERHILIFHTQWVSTMKKRIFIHYIPIIIIVLYSIMLYAIITPMNNCGRQFYYTVVFCGYYSCMYDSVTYSLYEFVSGGVLSSFFIGTGSISLALRVVLQKRRFRQQIQWRKYRKMAIQLLSVTSIFFVLYLPPILLAIAHDFGVPSYIGNDYNIYAQFLTWYIIFLFPFSCISTLPQLRNRIKNIFQCCYQRPMRVVPLQ